MKFNLLKSFTLTALIVAAAASCKKKEDTTVTPSLNGSLKFSAPEFVVPGTALKMTPKGAKHPDGGDLGYYWKVSPVMEKSDTVKTPGQGSQQDSSFTYTFPDSLGTYTIYCSAFAESGYSSLSGSNYVTVVKGGLEGSVRGRQILPNDPHETIDGIDYYYHEIGGLKWMRHNLETGAGEPFRRARAMENVFGKFYSYEQAVSACPSGWRLPTDAEWTELCKALGADAQTEAHSNIPGIAAKLMANVSFNSYTMWTYWREVGDPTNESKLAMIPVGYANLGEKASSPEADTHLDLLYPEASFKGLYEYATFWTADDASADEAYYRYLYQKSSELKIGKADKKYFGASVRCVK